MADAELRGEDSSEQASSTASPVESAYEVFAEGRDAQRLLSAKQVAFWLRRTEAQVIADAEAGSIPGRMIDGSWRFGVAAMNRWLEGSAVKSSDSVLAGAMQPVLAELSSLRAAVEAATRGARRGDDGLVLPKGQAIAFQLDKRLTLAELEEAYIRFVLQDCGGNKTVAAKWLGIDPSTLHRKLAVLERERSDSSSPNS